MVISFLFACKVVYDSFIHSLQNSTLTVTVEKWAMNARHLFECEFHWQSRFFAEVCSLLFSQRTERAAETMRGVGKNDWKISFLMINISLTFTEHKKKTPAAEYIKHLWLSVRSFFRSRFCIHRESSEFESACRSKMKWRERKRAKELNRLTENLYAIGKWSEIRNSNKFITKTSKTKEISHIPHSDEKYQTNLKETASGCYSTNLLPSPFSLLHSRRIAFRFDYLRSIWPDLT